MKPADRELSLSANATRPTGSTTVKRRSLRLTMEFPVVVFGKGLNQRMFREATQTITVSNSGTSLMLGAPVNMQQQVLLLNTKSGEQVQCRVAHRKEIDKNRAEVGLEFDGPRAGFWGIHFPPENWDPADRKRPNLPSKMDALHQREAKK
jgi:hypothetical protein